MATTDELIQKAKDNVESRLNGKEEGATELSTRTLMNLIEARRLEQFAENEKEELS